MLVSVPANETQKGEVLPDFGACNSKLSITVKRRKGWGAWYAIAFRDDLATAKLALVRSAVFRVADVKAPPCLFANPVASECAERLVAAAYGSEERAPQGVKSADCLRLVLVPNAGAEKPRVVPQPTAPPAPKPRSVPI